MELVLLLAVLLAVVNPELLLVFIVHLLPAQALAKLSRHPVALRAELVSLQAVRGLAQLAAQERRLGLVGERGDGLLSRLLEFVQDAEAKAHSI